MTQPTQPIPPPAKETTTGPATGSGGPSAGTPPEGPASTSPPTAGSGRPWALIAAAFVVGALLGGLVIGLARSGSGSTSASAPVTSTVTVTSTASPTGASTGGATIAVPQQCLQVASDAQQLAQVADQAVAAARDLNAAKLSDLVRQLDSAQTALRADGQACKDAGGSVSLPTSGTTPSGSVTLLPTPPASSTTATG